jgi:hypothetical protein
MQQYNRRSGPRRSSSPVGSPEGLEGTPGDGAPVAERRRSDRRRRRPGLAALCGAILGGERSEPGEKLAG